MLPLQVNVNCKDNLKGNSAIFNEQDKNSNKKQASIHFLGKLALVPLLLLHR